MEWNVVTYLNGRSKNHIIKTNTRVSATDVSMWFSIRYCGSEGEILEVIPL